VLHGGILAEGELVLHRCDNPPCVRPEHLFQGTQTTNMADMAAKGRSNQPTGARHGRTHLTEDDVRMIRDLYDRGIAQTALAKQYGVASTTIQAIVSRRNWKHVK
jgi:hypothetical protein